jgi:xylan 1,4-beta-xylosidase
VLRGSGDYYLTLSSFDACPGLPIWHSRELVNWQPIGHAITRNVGAIRAPDLVEHNSRYYLCFSPVRGPRRQAVAANAQRPPHRLLPAQPRRQDAS